MNMKVGLYLFIRSFLHLNIHLILGTIGSEGGRPTVLASGRLRRISITVPEPWAFSDCTEHKRGYSFTKLYVVFFFNLNFNFKMIDC